MQALREELGLTLTPQQEQAKASWKQKSVDQQVQYVDDHISEVLEKTPAATDDAMQDS